MPSVYNTLVIKILYFILKSFWFYSVVTSLRTGTIPGFVSIRGFNIMPSNTEAVNKCVKLT